MKKKHIPGSPFVESPLACEAEGQDVSVHLQVANVCPGVCPGTRPPDLHEVAADREELPLVEGRGAHPAGVTREAGQQRPAVQRVEADGPARAAAGRHEAATATALGEGDGEERPRVLGVRGGGDPAPLAVPLGLLPPFHAVFNSMQCCLCNVHLGGAQYNCTEMDRDTNMRERDRKI